MPRFSFDFKVLTFCLIGLMTTLGNASADDKESGVMTIGSKAPDIDIEHWVSDNDGAFSHTTSLQRDQVYVIEFWATWCGPCISAMPHIADLQKKHGDDIQVISVSDEDLETVEKFLERDVRGEEDMTYADLTKTYCLTTDPDESVKKDYFRAAGRTGIPCAFIVGKTGYVEWIGHPMRIDDPLKQVVNDEWDREKYLADYKKEQEEREAAKKAQAALRKASRKLQGLMEDGDTEATIKYIDEMLENDDFAAAKDQLSAMKLQIMVSEDVEGADKELEKYAKANSDNPAALNRLAWAIYEQHTESDGISEDLLKAACNCAEQAAKAEPKNGAVLDTYAHLIYAAHKDIDKAIEVQKQAVEHAGSQVDEIKPFLDELMKIKEEK